MDYKQILIQSLTIGIANGGKFEFFFCYLQFYLKYLVNAG